MKYDQLVSFLMHFHDCFSIMDYLDYKVRYHLFNHLKKSNLISLIFVYQEIDLEYFDFKIDKRIQF